MSRSKHIKIRLSEDELRKLKTIAGKRGVSTLLRRRALGIDRRQIKNERLMIVAGITRARNLLNQIARSCEQRPWPETLQILLRLINVEKEILKLPRK